MQIQHVDIVLTSSSQVNEGELAVPVQDRAVFCIPVRGCSEIWEAWWCPVGSFGDLAGFDELSVSTIPGDSSHVSVEVGANTPDKTLTVRLYVLGQ